MRLIALDNRTGDVSAEQAAFFTAAAGDSPLPILLLLHIPLTTPSSLTTRSAPRRSAGALGPRRSPLLPPAHSVATPAEATTATTQAFREAVEGCEQLAAVLSGHIHTAQAEEEKHFSQKPISPSNKPATAKNSHRLQKWSQKLAKPARLVSCMLLSPAARRRQQHGSQQMHYLKLKLKFVLTCVTERFPFAHCCPALL